MPFLLLLASVAMTQTPTSDSFLRTFAETRRFVAGTPVAPTFTPDGAQVLFLRSGPRSAVQTLWAFDVATGQTRELLTPEALLHGGSQTLSAEEKARLERQRISARGFTHFLLSEDGARVLVGLSGRLYVFERASGKVTPLAAEHALDAKFSPGGDQVSYVKGSDVYAVDLRTGKERAITRGGTPDHPHGVAEFVAQEEMNRFSGYWWSPDGQWIAFEDADLTPVETFHLGDSLHPEQAPEVFRYPRAGHPNAVVKLFLTRASGRGQPIEVKWDRIRYPYLAVVNWSKNAPLTVLVQNRQQTEEALLSVDPQGATRELLVETDPAWLNLKRRFPVWKKDGSAFFWCTERNGGPEIELRGKNGEMVSSWVPVAARYDEWVGFDEASGWLYFTAQPEQPESVVMRVREGGQPEVVPTGHEGPRVQQAALSKENARLVVTTSTPTTMPVWEVFGEGKRVGELPSVAEAPPFMPKVELRKVGEGEGFWSAVLRPRNAVRGQKLPVIVEVYGGPTATVVHASARENLLPQWIADQGFLVVKFDNRGTQGRGRDWERAIKFDFAGPTMDDQVAALHALAKVVPELDLARVGMEGWSFGGYMSALAVLKRGDVFKAAVAGAPVVDWTDYDTHYTERYLGVPQEHPEAYAKSSLLTYAPNLKGSLLLIHGTADDNVYFLHSLKLSNELFRNGRPHDLLPLAGFTHMLPDPLVTERLWQRIVGFFREKL
jgi:dipeptidyl-peptidase-4